MDLKKVSAIAQSTHAQNHRVSDSTKEVLKRIRDARKARRQRQIDDAGTNYAKFKKSPSYIKLCKRVKDALESTETTEEAVGVALEQLTPDTPAEQTLAAVVETLGETIDQLTEEEDPDDDPDDDPDE